MHRELIAALFALLVVPHRGRRSLRLPHRAFRWIARRQQLAVMLTGLVTVALSAVLSLGVHWPVPAIHDEFCYLIGADTFAHGRLTNPTHPLWEHFESFHMIYQPTYQMKYPPGQALFLAAGQLLGHPVVGVWLSLAAACAATCWMLQAWVPPRWALFGAMLPLLNVELLTWWGQTYWGGAVAMLGGALTFGALRRIARRPRTRWALLFGLGIAILANTRPYEGFVAVACMPLVLAPMFFGQRQATLVELLVRFVLPAVAVLSVAGIWMGYYNYRVTGAATRLPYQVWADTYRSGGLVAGTLLSPAKSSHESRAPRRIPFPNQRPAPAGKDDDSGNREGNSIIRRVVRKLFIQWESYLGLILTIPLLTFARLWQSRWTRFAIFTCLMVLLALVMQGTWGHPHYTAPVYPLLLMLVVQGCRYLQFCRVQAAPLGRWYVRMLPVLVIAMFGMDLSAWAKEPMVPFHAWSLDRAQILARLQRQGGRHLVVVRYSADHHPLREWVYNERADIDSAPVVWARELSPPQNRRLLEYFDDRELWLLEADKSPPRLIRHEK